MLRRLFAFDHLPPRLGSADAGESGSQVYVVGIKLIYESRYCPVLFGNSRYKCGDSFILDVR